MLPVGRVVLFPPLPARPGELQLFGRWAAGLLLMFAYMQRSGMESYRPEPDLARIHLPLSLSSIHRGFNCLLCLECDSVAAFRLWLSRYARFRAAIFQESDSIPQKQLM